MLMQVGYFCEKVESDMASLVDELAEITNRKSTNEILSWQRSLPKLSIALSQPGLQDFHISLGQSGGISLEYKLPAASAWCDAVLLGSGEANPAAVMIELKDWDTRGTQATAREGLVEQNGHIGSHPSDQVRGYVEYCQNFHSAVLENSANVAGCVLFTSSQDLDVFRHYPYTNLVSQYPVFSSQTEEIQTEFPDYLANYLKKPDYDFAQKFERGIYAQNRSLVDQIASLVLDDSKTIFVLLDEQRLGYELCLDEIDRLLQKTDNNEKGMIIIEGPPGSGKSVLAAKLWATLVKDERIKGNVVFTSTSSAQHSNWKTFFRRQAGRRAGGVVIRSNSYSPGFPAGWVKQKRAQGFEIEMSEWENNLDIFHTEHKDRTKDNLFDVSIVDEAHALIDPSVPDRGGIKNAGWSMAAGPQGYHIIRASKFSIFLLDAEQSYRDNETTTNNNLVKWAEKLGVEQILRISLGNSQFRCGGSKEYIEWLEYTLDLSSNSNINNNWRKDSTGQGHYYFELVKDPKELDEKLTYHMERGKSVRLAASYSREWITKGIQNSHELPPKKKDFFIPYERNGEKYYWARIWNYVQKNDYSSFVQAVPGSKMSEDPLCEVGCPYVMRGFDFDFLGILWLDDLYWDDNFGKWMVHLDNVYETAWSLTLARAKKEYSKGVIGENTETVIQQLQRGYRILLSRAIYGIYVWIENPITRKHIEDLLKN